MPVCEVCFCYYIRPQSFRNLWDFSKQCDICQTYAKAMLSYDVVPMAYNTVECYSYHEVDHPALTKKFFETIIHETNHAYLWVEEPVIIDVVTVQLLGALFHPLRLFQPEASPQNILINLPEFDKL